MFQFAAAGRKTCSCDDFNIADRLSRGLRRDTLERTRAGLVCLPLARVLRRLSSFDVLLVNGHLFPHPHFKLELRFSFICRKWNIDIVFAELNEILLCLADQDTFRGKKMECTIYYNSGISRFFSHARKYIWKAENTFHVELKTFERQKMVLKISNIVSRIGSRRLSSLKVTLILQNLQKLSSITFNSEAHVLHLSDTETILLPHRDLHSETLPNLPLQNPMHLRSTHPSQPPKAEHPRTFDIPQTRWHNWRPRSELFEVILVIRHGGRLDAGYVDAS